MTQILVIDVGNSRMKWAMRGPGGWTARGAVANQDIGIARGPRLAKPRAPRTRRSASTSPARRRAYASKASWRAGGCPSNGFPRPPKPAACINSYETPAQLGPDRWASLIAARRRAVAANESVPRACIVANAGTAVTIDALDGDGVFRGGLILPGIDLMLRALADNTAALRKPPGTFADFPTTTPDALFSGAVQAACGAIEQMRRQLRGHGPEVTCYLAGGSAPDIAPHLAAPVELVDNLVLEGVLVLALHVRADPAMRPRSCC